MQDKHLFEYAVIRIVPRVEREEFINTGVILYCAGQRFLRMSYEINEKRLVAFAPDLDIREIRDRLEGYARICAGGKAGGPIGQLPLASRFRWLTATCSTVVQTSPVHPGLCTDAQETLDALFRKLVQSVPVI